MRPWTTVNGSYDEHATEIVFDGDVIRPGDYVDSRRTGERIAIPLDWDGSQPVKVRRRNATFSCPIADSDIFEVAGRLRR